SDPMALPRHLAPESAAGRAASPAGDRYALGTIAFELLTGRPPFRVEVWPAELQPRQASVLPLPCSISPDLPRPLVKVLFKALAAGLVYQLVVQPTVALLAGRGGHATALLSSGEVLVAGGCTNIPPSPSVASVARSLRSLGGKDSGPGWLDTALLFAPAGNGW